MPRVSLRIRVSLVSAVLICAGLVAGCSESVQDPFRPDHLAPLASQDLEDPSIVVLETSENPPTQEELAALGVTALMTIPQISMMTVTSALPASELAALLRGMAFTVSAEPDILVENPEARGMTIAFNDGLLARGHVVGQDFLQTIHVSPIQPFVDGSGVTIGLIDTGLDYTHPDLAGVYAGGFDFVDFDMDPLETRDHRDTDLDGLVDEAYGHGTHLGGLLALLAPEAKVRVYRILDSDGWGTASGMIAALVLATLDGVDVVNMSMGVHSPFPALESAIDFAAANGVLVVTSAGNEGLATPQYPAGYENAVAVGASGAGNELAAFSNFGSHVFVAAPGVDIRSTAPGGGYAVWSGTSMSTAVVSALCALIESRDTTLTRTQVLQRVGRGSYPLSANLLRFGRVDFLQSIAQGKLPTH